MLSFLSFPPTMHSWPPIEAAAQPDQLVIVGVISVQLIVCGSWSFAKHLLRFPPPPKKCTYNLWRQRLQKNPFSTHGGKIRPIFCLWIINLRQQKFFEVSVFPPNNEHLAKNHDICCSWGEDPYTYLANKIMMPFPYPSPTTHSWPPTSVSAQYLRLVLMRAWFAHFLVCGS